MDRLIPANEFPNAFLDADRGPVPELPLGAPQVRAVSRTSPGCSPWRSIRASRPNVRPISSIKRRAGRALRRDIDRLAAPPAAPGGHSTR